MKKYAYEKSIKLWGFFYLRNQSNQMVYGQPKYYKLVFTWVTILWNLAGALTLTLIIAIIVCRNVGQVEVT